jgi:large subunit ribosomal protein L33
VKLRLSNAGLRTIDKNGIDAVLAACASAARRSEGGSESMASKRDKIRLISSANTATSTPRTRTRRTRRTRWRSRSTDPVVRKHVIYQGRQGSSKSSDLFELHRSRRKGGFFFAHQKAQETT